MCLLAPPKKRLWAKLTAACLHPSTREACELRNFALVLLFVAGLSLFNVLRTFYVLSVALANLGILVALFAFALTYLNHRLEATPFMIRLAGVTLMVMLAIMGIVGWVISPVYIAQYQPNLAVKRALRFTPNALGGYDIAEIPFAFETKLGENLHLDDGPLRECSEMLDVTFPFYG